MVALLIHNARPPFLLLTPPSRYAANSPTTLSSPPLPSSLTERQAKHTNKGIVQNLTLFKYFSLHKRGIQRPGKIENSQIVIVLFFSFKLVEFLSVRSSFSSFCRLQEEEVTGEVIFLFLFPSSESFQLSR